MPDDLRLSPHFTLAEMTRSQTALRLGINNAAPTEAVAELRRLCALLLEPIRALLGTSLFVSSGYRCTTLNQAVGGASASAHLAGRAADLIPAGVSLPTAFEMIRLSALPFDQVILECNAWIHVAVAESGRVPRRQAMTGSGGPGHWSYKLVAVDPL
jgi:hypothetical protein